MKISCRIITIMLVGLFLSTATFAQQKDRTLNQIKRTNEPLEILKLKVKGKNANFKEKFAGDDDWFRGLTVNVKNISSKTIIFIDLGIIFPKTEEVAQDAQASDHLLYGHYPPLPGEKGTPHPDEPPLNPGDTATLVLSDYEGTREFLNQIGKPQSIKEIQISIDEVVFADEIKWHAGQLMRRDPNDPNSWMPIPESINLNERDEPLIPMLSFKKASFNSLSFSSVSRRSQSECYYLIPVMS